MARRRRKSPAYRKPHLTVAQVLAWADDYQRRIARWPTHKCGCIRWTDETWLGVDTSLRTGNRGLPGGSSLANVLYKYRGVRSPGNVPPLTEREILRWASDHFRRMGKWPSLNSGSVLYAPGETWAAIDLALARATRGLPGDSSVAQLLAAAGAKRNLQRAPPLSGKQILAWADAYFKRHGEWPYRDSGPIAECPLETWSAVDTALKVGRRGLPGGASLAAFLNQHRAVYRGKSRRPKRIPESARLHVENIMAWGQAHQRRTGKWPSRMAGRVHGAHGLTWGAIDSALKRGNRGLPGGSSLAKLFKA